MTSWDPGGWDVLARARELSEAGEAFALATVVWRQAPSSGHVGSRAIVTADGRLEGWIGGACAEPVVLREARGVIEGGEPLLLHLGTSSDPSDEAAGVPAGARFVTMSCQSEGALQVFIEPVVPVVDLVVVGASPAASTLVALAETLGWRARRTDAADLAGTSLGPRTVVVVATQGHGDEEAVEWAVRAEPAFVGLVASRRRGETVLGYLADRGVPQHLLDRVRTPVGLDLGHTSHAEIGVSVLAELVRLRASGGLDRPPRPSAATRPTSLVALVGRGGLGPALPATLVGRVGSASDRIETPAADALDPVCGMTVPADDAHWPLEVDGTTYWFCCPPCHDRFAADPASFLQEA